MGIVLRIIGLIIAWGPVIISSVRRVEILLSGSTGEEKKQAAISLVKDTLSLRGIELTDQTVSLISGFIDFIVAALNAWKQWRLESVKTEEE